MTHERDMTSLVGSSAESARGRERTHGYCEGCPAGVDDGEVLADTDHGLGWEIAGGIAYGFGTGWTLNPGVRYRSLSRDLVIGDATTTVDLRYVALEVGVARRF